jgi:hypothetical protein
LAREQPSTLDVRFMLNQRQSVGQSLLRAEVNKESPGYATWFLLSSEDNFWFTHIASAGFALRTGRPESDVVGQLTSRDIKTLREIAAYLVEEDVGLEMDQLTRGARALMAVLQPAALDFAGSTSPCIEACIKLYPKDPAARDRCVLGCIHA